MDKDKLISELSFKAIRSSGSGGQHVNKVSSKIELQFDIETSKGIDDDEKALLISKLKARLTNDNRLILQCGESRSQHKNKEIISKRFLQLVEKSLKKDKPRKPTKIPKAVKQKRLEHKKRTSQKKQTVNHQN